MPYEYDICICYVRATSFRVFDCSFELSFYVFLCSFGFYFCVFLCSFVFSFCVVLCSFGFSFCVFFCSFEFLNHMSGILPLNGRPCRPRQCDGAELIRSSDERPPVLPTKTCWCGTHLLNGRPCRGSLMVRTSSVKRPARAARNGMMVRNSFDERPPVPRAEV